MRRPGVLAGLIVALAVSACGGTTATATPFAATAAPTASAPTSPSPLAAPPSASGSVQAPVAPSAAASASPPAAPVVFRSPRYPYSITLTRDWTATANPGKWTGVLDSASFRNPGTDLYDDMAPPEERILLIGFLPISRGMTLSAWAGAEAPRATPTECTDEAAEPATSLGGNQVILQRVRCGATFVVNAYLVHAPEGVLLVWISPHGNETADRATFLAILATLRFR